MKKNIAIVVMLIIFTVIYITARAQKEVYSVEYESASPLKEIPLARQELKIAVYSNGIPKGYQQVQTNENAKFSLDQEYTPPVAIEILSIKGEEKLNALCYGALTPESSTIKITCNKK